MSATVSTEWPLVGRDEVVERIDRFVSGEPERGLVFAGKAGVGKTRLRREVVARAEGHGHHVIQVAATAASSTVPLGVFAPHLRLPEGQSPAPSELLRAAHHSLTARTGGRRLLVSVDDGHLLDSLSAQLVHQTAVVEPISVVVTIRSGEPAPDPITALWKDELCDRVETPELDPEAVRDLIQASLPGVEPALSDRLAGLARGNPLFLRELILGAVDSRAIRREGERWQLNGSLIDSSRFEDLLPARLGSLGEDEREAVELLAVGEPIGFEALAAMVGLQPLRELRRRGIVEVISDGRREPARLTHPLLAGSVRASLLPETRRRHSAALSADLRKRGLRRADDMLVAAGLDIDAGELRDPESLTAAATAAASLFDGPKAERIAEAALAAGGGIDAELARCRGIEAQGRVNEAAVRLADLFEAAGDPEALIKSGAALAYLLTFQGARVGLPSRDVFAELRERLPEPAHTVVDALEAEALLWQGRNDRAEPLAHRALAAPGLDPASRAAAASVAGVLSINGPNPTHAIDRTPEHAAEAADAGLFGRALILRGYPVIGLAAVGRIDQAILLHERQFDGVPARLRTATMDGHSLGTRGFAKLVAGRPRSGFEDVDRAVLTLRAGGDYFGILRLATSVRAQGAALIGRPGDAKALRDEVQAIPGPELTFASELERACALIAFAGGDLEEGARLARVAADLAAEVRLPLWSAQALHDIVRNGHPRETRDDLAYLVEGAHQDWIVHHFLEHASALGAQDPDRLAVLAERLCALPCPLYAAEVAGHAAALLADEDPLRAFRLGRLCEQQAERAGTFATKAIAERPHILSERETEICELSAEGRTARQIADQLVLSSRTVENHLYRARAKLEMTRDESFADILAAR